MDDPTTLRLVFDPGRDAQVDRRRVELELGGGRSSKADVYRPAGAGDDPLAFVLFVAGDAPQPVMDGLLEWGQYRAWGEAVASRGLAAVVAEHASTDQLRRAPEVAAQIRDTLVALRAAARDLRLDASNVGVWTASGGASYGALAALTAEPPVRALVVYYGVLDVRGWAAHIGTLDAEAATSVSAAALASTLSHIPPTLLVTAGLDDPGINATAELFADAIAGKGEVTQLHHPTGRHAFDILDPDETSADIIGATLDFLVDHLRPE